MLTDGDISNIAIALCERRLANDVGNEPSTVASILFGELAGASNGNYRNKMATEIVLSPGVYSDLELLAALYRYRVHTMDSPQWDESLPNKWSANLMIMVALPHLSDTSAIFESIKGRIVGIEGFETELVRQTLPDRTVSDAEIKKRMRFRDFD